MRSRTGRDEGGRLRRDAGATLVEYGLVFAFFVVLSAGAIQALTTQAGNQIDNQADCVSTRPPPPECQTPAQSVPDDYDSFPPTTPSTSPPSSGSASFSSLTWNGTDTIDAVILIQDGGPDPVPDAVVQYRWRCSNGGGWLYNQGSTDSSGELTLALSCPGGGTATVQVTAVISDYAVSVPITDTVDLS